MIPDPEQDKLIRHKKIKGFLIQSIAVICVAPLALSGIVVVLYIFGFALYSLIWDTDMRWVYISSIAISLLCVLGFWIEDKFSGSNKVN